MHELYSCETGRDNNGLKGAPCIYANPNPTNVYQHAWSYWQGEEDSDPVTVRHIVVADHQSSPEFHGPATTVTTFVDFQPRGTRYATEEEHEARLVAVEPTRLLAERINTPTRHLSTTPSILTDKTGLLYQDIRPFSYTKVS